MPLHFTYSHRIYQELKRNRRGGASSSLASKSPYYPTLESILNILRNNNQTILKQSQSVDTLMDKMKTLDIGSSSSSGGGRGASKSTPNKLRSGGAGGDVSFSPGCSFVYLYSHPFVSFVNIVVIVTQNSPSVDP